MRFELVFTPLWTRAAEKCNWNEWMFFWNTCTSVEFVSQPLSIGKLLTFIKLFVSLCILYYMHRWKFPTRRLYFERKLYLRKSSWKKCFLETYISSYWHILVWVSGRLICKLENVIKVNLKLEEFFLTKK